MKLLYFTFLLFAAAACISNCTDAMVWYPPQKAANPIDLPEICVVISDESINYRASYHNRVYFDDDAVRLGYDLLSIIEYEVSKYFKILMIVIRKDPQIENVAYCPAHLRHLELQIIKIDCAAESNSLGVNFVSAKSWIKLSFQNENSDKIVSARPSSKVVANWVWFTVPTYDLGRSAIPKAIQLSLRSNLDFIASCNAGDCKTEADMIVPDKVWASDVP